MITVIDSEGLEPEDFRYSITYSDGFRDLHYPPPPEPKTERNIEPNALRSLRDHRLLTAMFDGLEGGGIAKHGWKNKVGWDREEVSRMHLEARRFFEDISNWFGVGVENGRISHLRLNCNRLRGKLPAELWRLEHVLELNLSGNEIQGAIPTSVSKLSSLTWLDLSSNQLDGKIPRSIGGCSRLKVLDLSCNQLVGPIPTTLGRLTELRECRLFSNLLTGVIPQSFAEALKFCEDLIILDISENTGLKGVEVFKTLVRRFLPMCTIFVGSPRVEPSTKIQDFNDRGIRVSVPEALKVLNESAWEDEFPPPWSR